MEDIIEGMTKKMRNLEHGLEEVHKIYSYNMQLYREEANVS